MAKARFKIRPHACLWIATLALLLPSCKRAGDMILNFSDAEVIVKADFGSGPSFKTRISVGGGIAQPRSREFRLVQISLSSTSGESRALLSIPNTRPAFRHAFGDYTVYVIFNEGIFPVPKHMLGEVKSSKKAEIINYFDSYQKREGKAITHPINVEPFAPESIPPASHHRFPEELAWIRQQLATASVSDGVSRDEAKRLAVAYWTRFCSRCGMVDSVRDSREYWRAKVYTGYIAVPKGDILIHKTTGHISWKGGPTVTNWSQLWE